MGSTDLQISRRHSVELSAVNLANGSTLTGRKLIARWTVNGRRSAAGRIATAITTIARNKAAKRRVRWRPSRKKTARKATKKRIKLDRKPDAAQATTATMNSASTNGRLKRPRTPYRDRRKL